jgi:hypothetical protein
MMAVHVTIEARGVTIVRTVTFYDRACSYQHGELSFAELCARQDEVQEMLHRWHCMGCKACRDRVGQS